MRKVHLTITSRQRMEDKEETVTGTTAAAEYYERNGSRYIFYEEPLENMGIVKNTIKIKGSVLELTRKGAVTTRMVFETGREYAADYATPYGCMKIGVFTRKMETVVYDGQMEIRAEYTLSSEGYTFSDTTITIKLQE